MITRPIEKKYCEGKVKSTLMRVLKVLEIIIRKTDAIVVASEEFCMGISPCSFFS